MSNPTSTIARLDVISDYLPYLAIGVGIYGIVVIGIYVWYSAALARVFTKLGAAPWKAWVPIVSEAELLTRGGVPGWSVVYLFIPLLNIYGLVLHIQAVHRINLQFGKGAGLTVLNLLVSPVWATVLAMANGTAQGANFDRRVASATVSSGATGPLSAASTTTTTGGAVPPMAPASPAVPPAAPASPAVPPMAPSGPAVPPMAPSGTAVPTAPAAVVDPSPSLVVETPAPVAAPLPKQESTGGLIVNPWAPAPATPDIAAAVPAPIAPLPPATPPVTSLASPPAESPAALIAQPAESVVEEEDDEDDFETVVVDRRPKTQWSLVLDDGRSFALTAETVALGRKPASEESAVQLLAIEDSTKTLSKTHALLRANDDIWTILDLDSTNGVLTVGDDGTETLLPTGGSTQVNGRFLLGKVGMRVSADQDRQ
jgi:hypothetical protein